MRQVHPIFNIFSFDKSSLQVLMSLDIIGSTLTVVVLVKILKSTWRKVVCMSVLHEVIPFLDHGGYPIVNMAEM
jgi:hypothetical protein